jgi:hypothetical protein
MGDDENAVFRLWRENRGEIDQEDLSGNLIVQPGVVTELLNRRCYERNTCHTLERRQLLSGCANQRARSRRSRVGKVRLKTPERLPMHQRKCAPRDGWQRSDGRRASARERPPCWRQSAASNCRPSTMASNNVDMEVRHASTRELGGAASIAEKRSAALDLSWSSVTALIAPF